VFGLKVGSADLTALKRICRNLIPNIEGNLPRCAADVLDWGRATVETMDKYKVIKIPYIPSREACVDPATGVLSDEWRLGYHGSHL